MQGVVDDIGKFHSGVCNQSVVVQPPDPLILGGLECVFDQIQLVPDSCAREVHINIISMLFAVH